MIRFEVVGLPAPQGSKRIVPSGKPGGRVHTIESSKSLPAWRRLVADEAQRHAPDAPITGAVRLFLAFRLPIPASAPKRRRLFAAKRPDLSKLTRAVEDALTGVMWKDDSQVVRLSVSKDLAYEGKVGVTIRIEDLEGQDTLAVPTIYRFDRSGRALEELA